jgi:nicotinamide riboside kinase
MSQIHLTISPEWTKGVGVIGPEGSGKTTLLKALSAKLDVPILSEYVRQVMREMGFATPPTLGSSLDDAKRFQAALSKRREKLIAQINGPFLSDRSPLDSWLYTLSALARDAESQTWLGEYYDSSMDSLHWHYHALIYIPHGRIGSVITPDGVRSSLWFNSLMMHNLFMGALQECKVKFHIVESSRLTDRVDETLKALHDWWLIYLD